jgi:hypothetical protein
MNKFLSHLKQRSTWAGIASLVALTGWQVSPDQFSAISAVIIALVGAYEVIRNEKK